MEQRPDRSSVRVLVPLHRYLPNITLQVNRPGLMFLYFSFILFSTQESGLSLAAAEVTTSDGLQTCTCAFPFAGTLRMNS